VKSDAVAGSEVIDEAHPVDAPAYLFHAFRPVDEHVAFECQGPVANRD
jgi:hypothetical protein